MRISPGIWSGWRLELWLAIKQGLIAQCRQLAGPDPAIIKQLEKARQDLTTAHETGAEKNKTITELHEQAQRDAQTVKELRQQIEREGKTRKDLENQVGRSRVESECLQTELNTDLEELENLKIRMIRFLISKTWIEHGRATKVVIDHLRINLDFSKLERKYLEATPDQRKTEQFADINQRLAQLHEELDPEKKGVVSKQAKKPWFQRFPSWRKSADPELSGT